MNRNFVNEVANLIFKEFDFFAAPTSLNNTIVDFARKLAPQTSGLTLAEDILDENLPNYISALLTKIQEAREAGGFCPYEILENDVIVGFSYPRFADSEVMSKLRQIAPEVPITLETLRELQPDEFELFCSKVLDLLAAEETLKTKDSNDEGIDFLGWLCLPKSFVNTENILLFHRDFRMLVVGQAKRYKPENPIGVGYIRELVGTVAAFHHDQLAPWESKLQLQRTALTVMSPILPLMMTTGRISKDARALAKNVV